MEDYDVGNYWIKVWAGDNEASAKWFPLKDYDAENKVMMFDVKPTDAKAMFQVEDAAPFMQADMQMQMYVQFRSLKATTRSLMN